MDYATPRSRGTRRRRRLRLSLYLAAAVIGLSIFLRFFVSPYWGSVPLVNQQRVAGTYLVWGLCIVYVWQRLREDNRWPHVGLVILGVGAVIAAVALPIQIVIWRVDPGNPLPRSRLTTVPLAWAAVGLTLAAVGRGITHRCNGPARRQASPESESLVGAGPAIER